MYNERDFDCEINYGLASIYPVKFSILQTTMASSMSKLSRQTVPQAPLLHTSNRPPQGPGPLESLTDMGGATKQE